jgi:hypothetical protein
LGIEQGGEDYLFAYVRRKYGEDDIESEGKGTYIGAERVAKYRKITDKDPDSDTFGKRIDEPGAEPIGTRVVFNKKATPENIKKFQEMCEINNYGETKFYWKFRERTVPAFSKDEFWNTSIGDAHSKYILGQKEVVVIEKDKPNPRRRSSKVD